MSSYVALATTTLGSAASSVTFSSIPASYKDLVVIVSTRSLATNTNGIDMKIQFNSDTTATNYSFVSMESGNNGVRSLSGADNYIARLNSSQSSNTDRGTIQISVLDYSATNKHKSGLSRTAGKDGAADFGNCAHAFRWANTNAITSLRLLSGNNDFASGATFSLYGVA